MDTKFETGDIIEHSGFYYMILHVENKVYTVLSLQYGDVNRYNHAYFDERYRKVA